MTNFNVLNPGISQTIPSTLTDSLSTTTEGHRAEGIHGLRGKERREHLWYTRVDTARTEHGGGPEICSGEFSVFTYEQVTENRTEKRSLWDAVPGLLC